MKYLFGILSIIMSTLSFVLKLPRDMRMWALIMGSIFWVGAVILERLDKISN